MQNQAQSFSDDQTQLIDNINYPKGWQEPNPDLYPSPFAWSGSYTSPAWNAGTDIRQSGGGGSNPVFTHSNQFNSAVSQPLGLHINWQGRDKVVGNQMIGGMREPSDSYWDGDTSRMRLLTRKFEQNFPKRQNYTERPPIWMDGDTSRVKTINIPSQRFTGNGKKYKHKRK